MTSLRYRPPRGFGSWARAYWANMQGALRSWRWWTQNLIFLAFWVALGWPVYEKNIALGLTHTTFTILALAGRAWRFGGPRDMQLVERDYLTRKNRLYKLISRMQYRESMSDREIAEFQQDA